MGRKELSFEHGHNRQLVLSEEQAMFERPVAEKKEGGVRKTKKRPAKTAAQEVSGNMWMTPPLCHLCQKWTWGVTAVNLSHSRNRALDAIAAATREAPDLAPFSRSVVSDSL